MGLSGRTTLQVEKSVTQNQHGDLSWLNKHQDVARSTDQLKTRDRYTDILILGLAGEVGSILSEQKKAKREQDAYPRHRHRLKEELGDTLWYLLRIVDAFGCDITTLNRLVKPPRKKTRKDLDDALELGVAVGDLLRVTRQSADTESIQFAVERVAGTLSTVAARAELNWPDIADSNQKKVLSRWPQTRDNARVEELTALEEERFPRRLRIEIRTALGKPNMVILRSRGLNIGDRLTDNIKEQDYYRFHDVFHFSYAVYLGWSPVLRSLLKCKRKSLPEVDENEDGARAQIVEEAVSAYVFAQAKAMNYFDGVDSLDYELLKTISELIRGYEVEKVPLFRWEEAILFGYGVFRDLRKHKGGSVVLDFKRHTLAYYRPKGESAPA